MFSSVTANGKTTTSAPSSVVSTIEQIRADDKTLNAWTHLAIADGLQHVPETASPLNQMPFGVKDVLDVAGMPTRCGSDYIDDTPAARDAACVAALRRAGAIPVGKTQTAEFAYRRAPSTQNPNAPGHTPGGSSSGSAAAVAAKMVPFSLSTQTGGSIIRPAAYCGTVGFKPSFGAIARNGLAPGCESLDTIGWHASDIHLSESIAHVLMDHEYAVEEEQQPASQLRFLCIDRPADALQDSAVHLTLMQACQLLCQYGASRINQDAVHDRMLANFSMAHGTIMHYELARSLRPLIMNHPNISQPVAQLLRDADTIGRPDYIAALKLQQRARASWDAFAQGADFIIAPSAPAPAPYGLSNSGSSVFCRPWSFLGWPCIHLPIGVSPEGLPIGFQIIGPWQSDFEIFPISKLLWNLCNKSRQPLSFTHQ